MLPTDSSPTPPSDHPPVPGTAREDPAPGGPGVSGTADRPGSRRTALTPGAAVPVRWTKWPGSEHWEHECVWLGTDEHGDWVGQRAGARSWRPGRDYRAQTPNVVLVPSHGDWAATFYGPGHAAGMEVYVDLGRSVGWAASGPATVVGVDMDLDVVRDTVRGTWVDDEDELEEHAVLWDYPPEVVTHLESVARALRDEVEARRAPFDGPTATGWLARLSALSPTG